MADLKIETFWASQARPSSLGGISMPSVLAVLKLMTSSYFVGGFTGRSAVRGG
jgi:hypothetical protein